jgi:hypothetical protein
LLVSDAEYKKRPGYVEEFIKWVPVVGKEARKESIAQHHVCNPIQADSEKDMPP